MCNICKNPRSRAQARAKERILKAERQRAFRKGKRIASLLKRKQYSPRDQEDTFLIARSRHTGNLIKGRHFSVHFPYNSLSSRTPNTMKEENIFLRDAHRNFVFIPMRRLKFERCHDYITSYDGMILLHPSLTDLRLLRAVATEVPL